MVVRVRLRRVFLVISVLVVGALLAFNFSNIYKGVVGLVYPVKYEALVLKYSKQYGVDPRLVFAIIRTESGFNPQAVSVKSAKGLMQITEKTATWAVEKLLISGFSENSIFEPELNIQIGCWYLANLRDEFDGDMSVAVAAYNGGSGNVRKWLGDQTYSFDGKTLAAIPFKETDKYVEKVFSAYNMYKKIY